MSDEVAHFQRADQVSLGYPIGYRLGSKSGGVVDDGIADSFSSFYPIVLHPKVKVSDAALDTGEAVGWHEGKTFHTFENTSIYPPFFYSLAALSIVVGKAVNLDVVSTLDLARLADGLAAVGIGALAIALAGPAAPWVFSVFALPMTMSQMASASQDALMFPIAGLAAALFLRMLRDDDADRVEFVALCVLLALISTGRITQTALAVLPLALRRIPMHFRLVGCVAIVAAGAVWSWLASHYALVQFGLHGADSAGQVHLLLTTPSKMFDVAANTMRYQFDLYVESFVGKLGWLDLPLPRSYHVLARLDLVLALLLSVTAFVPRQHAWTALVTFAALLASIGALFAALYVSWTPVGNFIVDGVQGRYFIPLAFFVPALVTLGRPLSRGWAGRCGNAAVAAFPFVTLPVMILGLVARYYLT